MDYDQISANETERFQKILLEAKYEEVIRVFNEKGIAKSIGHYFGIENSSYCATVLSLFNGSKHDEILSAILPYLPNEIPH